MRRIEALTGTGADAWLDDRVAALERAAETVGAQSVDVLPDRIKALQDELREARRRLKAGGAASLPKPGELAATAEEIAPGVRLVSFAGPYESIDALKGAAKDLRGVLGSGVIALGLDADEPQIFVTVSDDLVSRGVSAGDLVKEAMAAIDGRGGGRPEMAQGKGTRREGLADSLASVAAASRSRVGPEA
jgi:alanyl-tRNA synthetase